MELKSLVCEEEAIAEVKAPINQKNLLYQCQRLQETQPQNGIHGRQLDRPLFIIDLGDKFEFVSKLQEERWRF